MKEEKSNHYINKKEFHDELVKYHNMPHDNRKLSDYIGNCIIMICHGLAKRPNFSGYTYLDEMVSDGIENCIMAVKSYDVTHSAKNPFWYFSKIASWAFVRRIQNEKKQQYIKHKNVQQYFLQGDLEDIETNELSDKVVSEYENKQAEIKLRKILNTTPKQKDE
jgi:hypothetical protein